jgi:hypothetical protein
MYKILIIAALLLSGCSNFTINATMCEKIASEPGAIMPKECKNYSEKEADAAFNKVEDKKKIADKDIKFEKKEE